MPPKTRKPTSRSVSRQIKAYMKKNVEKKRISYVHDTTISTTAADFALCDSIVGGTGSNNRVGHEIRATGWFSELYFIVADTTNMVRVVIYVPASPTVTLASLSLSVTSIIDPDKFRVLYDRLVPLSSVGANYIKKLRIKLNLRNLPIRYDGSTGAPTRNQILMTYVSDSGAVSHPSIKGRTLLYYNDM